FKRRPKGNGRQEKILLCQRQQTRLYSRGSGKTIPPAFEVNISSCSAKASIATIATRVSLRRTANAGKCPGKPWTTISLTGKARGSTGRG
uniref:hypothetical protein n=1 Tax=Barnesiella intestinihominis TaxID=487174 RepID=UPI003FEE533C